MSTGSITAQFHIVFDDLFTTLPSIEREEEPQSHWEYLCLENTVLISRETNPLISESDQRTHGETHSDRRMERTTNQVRSDIANKVQISSISNDPLLLPSPSTISHQQSGPSPEVLDYPTRNDSLSSEGVRTHQESSTSSEGAASTESASILSSTTEGSSISTSTGTRRSTRANKGQYSSTRYINEVFLAAVEQISDLSSNCSALVYLAELQTNFQTGKNDIIDPRVYNAKFNHKGLDPDAPTFHQAMASPGSCGKSM